MNQLSAYLSYVFGDALAWELALLTGWVIILSLRRFLHRLTLHGGIAR